MLKKARVLGISVATLTLLLPFTMAVSDDCRSTRMECNTTERSASGYCCFNFDEPRCGTCDAAGGSGEKDCNTIPGERCAKKGTIVDGVCDNVEVGQCGGDVPDHACSWGWCQSLGSTSVGDVQ